MTGMVLAGTPVPQAEPARFGAVVSAPVPAARATVVGHVDLVGAADAAEVAAAVARGVDEDCRGRPGCRPAGGNRLHRRSREPARRR